MRTLHLCACCVAPPGVPRPADLRKQAALVTFVPSTTAWHASPGPASLPTSATTFLLVFRPPGPRASPPQIPGVPIMYLAQHRYTIERLPEATVGGAPR